ncbi:cytidylate kinase family protein [Papillibacter cinnamivorans]|uniref:cytidylate kinase family protein n=1 Tax=Papillibacter cinnamivorans TaxID=100176 RepID=UPI001FA82ACD|nr:cytidylate kinase family protein [Papillibacter cinnamivorans]
MITISRQPGSLGDEFAHALAVRLGWELITRERIVSEFLSGFAGTHELQMLSESAKFYLHPGKDGKTFLEHLKQSLFEYTAGRPAVLMGFGSQVIFAGRPDALHIRVIAPESVRIGRIRQQYRVSEAEAKGILSTSDRKHKRFVSALFGADLTSETLYSLTVNTGDLSVGDCVEAVLALLRSREDSSRAEPDATPDVIRPEVHLNPAEPPVFKNSAEQEFARILDMYRIEWKYEPKTFPIEWDAEGNVTLAFSPDFYLTRFDTYIELTTMNQKYVTRKNKKAKKLRELYPGINIKIVYKKDYATLLERFRPPEADA